MTKAINGVKKFIAAALLAALSLAVSGCGASLGSGLGAPFVTIEETTNDSGDYQLVLEPVDVWNIAAGDLQDFTVSGAPLKARVAENATFERAWLRAGLFWDSRNDTLVMPVVITAGGAVRFQKARIETGAGGKHILKVADWFSFTPGKRPFDKAVHGGAFELSPRTLKAIANADDITITILTDRGSLSGNLAVAASDRNSDLAANAKYLFADFYRRREARL